MHFDSTFHLRGSSSWVVNGWLLFFGWTFSFNTSAYWMYLCSSLTIVVNYETIRLTVTRVWLLPSRLWTCSTARCKTESCWPADTWCGTSAARTATASWAGCTSSPLRKASATRRAVSSWRGRWWGRAKGSSMFPLTTPEFTRVAATKLNPCLQRMDLHGQCAICE